MSKKVYIVLVTLLVLIVLVSVGFLADKLEKTEQDLQSLKVCATEAELREALSSDVMTSVIIQQAPLTGTLIEEDTSILSAEGVANEDLLYVRYMLQEQKSHTNSDGKTEYSWEPEETATVLASNKMYMYGDIELEGLKDFHFNAPNQAFKYLNDRERYWIGYILQNDSITCKAMVGNNVCVIMPSDSIFDQVVFNKSVDGFIDETTERAKIYLIATVVAGVFFFLIFSIMYYGTNRKNGQSIEEP